MLKVSEVWHTVLFLKHGVQVPLELGAGIYSFIVGIYVRVHCDSRASHIIAQMA